MQRFVFGPLTSCLIVFRVQSNHASLLDVFHLESLKDITDTDHWYEVERPPMNDGASDWANEIVRQRDHVGAEVDAELDVSSHQIV